MEKNIIRDELEGCFRQRSHSNLPDEEIDRLMKCLDEYVEAIVDEKMKDLSVSAYDHD